MDIMSILLNSAAGAGGGFLGNMVKKNGLGLIGNLIAGAVGGNAGSWIATAAGLIGESDGGGLNIMSIIASLVGGSGASLLGGLFKKAA